MKIFYSIILSFLLGSCVFSKKSDQLVLQNNQSENSLQSSVGCFIHDSMTVNIDVEDYKIFYRISEYKHVADDQSSLPQKEGVTDKRILLNIQKADTISVLAYKVLEVTDFSLALREEDSSKYFIDSFCLKEVNRDSVVFKAKICMFEQDLCQNIDLRVNDDGTIVYSYLIVDEMSI